MTNLRRFGLTGVAQNEQNYNQRSSLNEFKAKDFHLA
jgi:hypothetical protein